MKYWFIVSLFFILVVASDYSEAICYLQETESCVRVREQGVPPYCDWGNPSSSYTTNCNPSNPPRSDCSGTPPCDPILTVRCTQVDDSFCGISNCGNGIIDSGEDCDGSNLNGKTCADFPPLTSGTLSCTSTCKFDTSQCFRPQITECEPGYPVGSSKSCGTCGTQTCESDGFWSTCTGDGRTESQSCGNCGTQSRTCQSNGDWSAWGSCTGEGPCSSGSQRSCDSNGDGFACGTQTCSSTCSWGSCTGDNAIACSSNSQCPQGQECQNPGTCQATCVDCVQAPACYEDADCPSGQICLNPGECGAFCASCKPGSTIGCGNCGTKTCQSNGNWGTCAGEGVCSSGSIRCSGTKTQTCNAQCQWQDYEDCTLKASLDSDGSSTAYTVFGTVTDYTTCSSGSCTGNNYDDSCSSATLTEYGASGASFSSGLKNCNDYDNNCWCSVSGTSLNENCDDWNCISGACKDSGSDLIKNSWSCSSSNQCNSQSCQGTSYKCYRSNSGSWTWGVSAEITETNCNDGYDNDCDNYIDAADSNCALTLQLSPNPADPSQQVIAKIAETYTSGTIIVKDYLGCTSGTEICRFSPPTSNCKFNAPTASGTYGYYACIGQNFDQEILSVTSATDHCSSAVSHTSGDDVNPSKYKHYYTTLWKVDDCDYLDSLNCRNQCNTATGDIDQVCDDYHCNNAGCVDSGSDWTRISKTQDCIDNCIGEVSASYLTSDQDLTDNELCSSGQSTCPLTKLHDNCNGINLNEYYCSANDGVVSVVNCNNYDGWACSGNIRENRDYSCFDPSAPNGAYCNYVVSSSEDCAAKLSSDSDGSATAYTVGGIVTDYTGCAPSACTTTTYNDSCSGTILTEYGASGALFTSSNYDCQNYETNYCLGDRYYRQEWGCSGTPGFCNDAAVPDSLSGTNADNDAKDFECGDSLCDNAAGVYDSTKTATETDCADNLDNDCDGLKDCQDSDCSGSASGKVSDTANIPIYQADVTAKQGTTTIAEDLTDENGDYAISSLKCGDYSLTASHSNYQSQTKSAVVPPNTNVVVNFNLVLGTSCEPDCTYASDENIHSSCDGINGCTFCDDISKAACENAKPGWERDYNATHYVVCPSGCPQVKIEIPATVSCKKGSLVKMTRLVSYKGKLVRMIVAVCG